jgi:hypothetical protein|tara:strand:+ start:547 stop:771 length:225 start_codon:yes stop_codon:yes gene_type:complete
MTITIENKFRLYRNKLLKECDWTQANDSPLSDSKKEEWKVYRQALRDMTKTVKPEWTEHGTLKKSAITFPTKPS